MYRQNYPDDPGMHNRGPERYGTRYALHHEPTFLERVKAYALAIVVGLGLICTGCVVLFWNEGRTVQTYKSLEEGFAQVRSLNAEVPVIEENNNKLIHISGPLRTLQPLHDSMYGVAVTAVKLKRTVEMFQWIETEHKREIQELDRVRTEVSYSYSQEWRNHLVNSNSFEKRVDHNNPESMPLESYTEVAKEVQVGSFLLSDRLVEKIGNFKTLHLVPTNSSKQPDMRLRSSMYYYSGNPDNPQVGDFRVSFEYAGNSESSNLGPPDEVSVIGRQSRNTVTSFHTRNGNELEILYMGRLSAEEVFNREQTSNMLTSWALRFVGWLLLFIGFTLMTSFINAIVSWVPIVRDLVNLGMMMMCMSLSISVSLTTIAIGWLWYRPILGVSILALAALPFLLARWRRTAGPRGASRTDRIW